MKIFLSVFCAVCFLSACNSGSNKEAALLKAKQATIDSMKVVIEKQAVIDSMNTIMAQNEEKNKQIVANNAAVAQEQVVQTTQTQATQTTKKKKWNNTAKGAAIGAGGGAVAGAIIGKDRAKGALVGSLIGAGVGTATGLVADGSKKKKNKQN